MSLFDSTISKDVRTATSLSALRLTFGSHWVIFFIGRQGQGQLGMLARAIVRPAQLGTWNSSGQPAFLPDALPGSPRLGRTQDKFWLRLRGQSRGPVRSFGESEPDKAAHLGESQIEH